MGDGRDGRAVLRAESASGDRRSLSGVGDGSRFVIASARRRRARIGAVATLAATVVWLVAAATASAFNAQGSVEQVYVTGLAPSAQMSLLRSNGDTVSTQTADSLGGLLFRHVAPEEGYRVRLSSTGEESAPITVHTQAAAPWDPSIYSQSIPDSGYTYLTTRDGTQLAIDVHLPLTGSQTRRYPTLIEYSGYGYANPAGPENGIAEVANLMGFAVVDVNMRGTGCSGGAFDYFETLENLDAYDVIETIAKQPWVAHQKVGMLGISYGGISQLFAAQTQPHALDAIAPLSVVDATATTLYAGGILNTGFAVPWAEERQHDAEPAGPESGEHWAYQQIQNGDETCSANQDLHGEAANLLTEIKENATYNPSVADPLDPVTFVHNIKVPTFMACQWEDEQTGGHCADLAEHFTGTKHRWFTFTNGAHADSLDPDTFDRLYDFLELFVAHKAPIHNRAFVDAVAPTIYQTALGLPKEDAVTLPPDPIQEMPKYEEALKAFEALPEVRVLFDNGAGASPSGSTTAGNPYPAFEQSFSAFPIPGTTAQSWYLGPEGALNEQPATTQGVDSYTSDASATPLTDYSAQHGPRRAVGRCVSVGMELGAAHGRVGRVLCVSTAQQRYDRDRWRRREPLGAVIHTGRRSSGDDQRGAPRRQRNVRPGRLDPRQRAQARHHVGKHVQADPHAAPADPHFPCIRCEADATWRIRSGHDPAVLRGTRLSRGLAHQGHDLCAQRHTAHLVVQPDAAGRHHCQRVDRIRARHARQPHTPNRAGRQCAHRTAALPEPAQRALPPVQSIRERRFLTAIRVAERDHTHMMLSPHRLPCCSVHP